ncbi:hypothetical protein [Hyunsoonleella pacifica]|uniref:TIR domain-containing protein n=1 Tax=Hyunsoonleella pacifica TaxID=1080224 RepID=A0A4Q9FS89_9FLAO|nr:hypothetical protein [Hyunsoonleella pacifica]TBN18978.1 hypothetical protein EYD46_02625 [Hyunsoonleella pacifica]GGD06300.1 hypothetical protein GCM10011368_05210 [Hyunsoonleella pacifica]
MNNKVAFISYALRDSEQFVLTLLSNLLREEGYSINSSYDDYMHIVQMSTHNSILKSSLFIGLITQYGDRNQNVFNEWQVAVENDVPNLLLIEDSVNIASELLNHNNLVRFNRNYPNQQIENIKARIKNAKGKSENNSALGWLLGGIAAVAIIKLLSDE